jgi:hypothetical protein
MAIRKTLNFLPDIFRTEANKKFLGATFDQLVSEPDLTRINGFVGRKFSLSYGSAGSFVEETDTNKSNYQFEPAVVVKNERQQIDLYSDYNDLITKIGYYGGKTDNHNRLFKSEYYNYNPRIDLDKFINYTRYYWLPNGPDAVTITSGNPLVPKTFVFSRQTNSYTTDQTGSDLNPEITLVRGVTYNFTVPSGGTGLWIQTEPGTDGLKNFSQKSSTREIFGVSNNGVTSGNVIFTVPLKDDQDYYFTSPIINYVKYATDASFSSIDGAYWNQPSLKIIGDIDGETGFPDGSYIVFLGALTPNTDWITASGSIVPMERRKGLWKINIAADGQVNLEFAREIPVGHRILVSKGNTYSGREYFKSTSGDIIPSPPITAPLTTLYYQDANNPNIFGKIKIVEGLGGDVNVNTDILNKKTYTSPTGIVFTNGLKVFFDGTITPEEYRNKTYIVEGVGTGIKLVKYSDLQSIEGNTSGTNIPFDIIGFDMTNYDEPTLGVGDVDYITIKRQSADKNAWSRANRWFHEDVILKTAEYNKTEILINEAARAKRPIIEFDPDLQLFNYGRNLLDFIDRVDEQIISSSVSQLWPEITDAFAQINNQQVSALPVMDYKEGQTVLFPNDLDIAVRSKIYRVGFKDQSTSQTFDGIGTGTVSVAIGTYRMYDIFPPASTSRSTIFRDELEVGSFIFNWNGQYVGRVAQIPNDYELLFEQPAQAEINIGRFRFIKPRIELIPIKTASAYDYIVAKEGWNPKMSYWFNGASWVKSQAKQTKNQAPLFDVIDDKGISFSDQVAYPESTFKGTKIFSYRPGTGLIDSVLRFAIYYNSISGSVADITFENSFDNDTFSYRPVDLVVTKKINIGYIQKLINQTQTYDINVWDTVAEPTKQYQHITASYDGTANYFEIDILPEQIVRAPNLKVFVNNREIPRDGFEIRIVGVRKAVYIFQTLALNDKIDIFIYSNSVSALGYYPIPSNLEFNPLNKSVDYITLGQMRGHYVEIGNNTFGVKGNLLDSNNVRDLLLTGNGGKILRHSAPTIYSSLFLTDSSVNFINSIDYARKEYNRFKNKFLEMCLTLTDLDKNDPINGVDQVLVAINGVKNSTFPWFYSGMVPSGKDYVVDTYTVKNVNLKIYSLPNIYEIFQDEIYPESGLTNKAILVYLNGNQLIQNKDYYIALGTPAIEFTESVQLSLNDVILVKGYRDTDGSYIPETPTKLGLYPKFIPGIYLDDTYRDPVSVIQGHDGSLIPVFNDIRDQYLLELEKRIYNNIRVEYNKDVFDINSVRPGKFRTSDYTRAEYNEVLSVEFLKWIGFNQLDFSDNSSFQPNDQFSWNYSLTTEIIGGELLPGYWRAIYKYYYDTDRPHTHPWEMLGYSDQPFWWAQEYGNGPYLPNNPMWADLANGLDKGTGKVNPTYARPGLLTVIPVDNSGNLLPPMAKVVKNFDGSKFNQPYQIGDGGPVESAWARTSEYPYAVVRAISLLVPAKFFSLNFDVTSIKRDDIVDQYYVSTPNENLKPELIKINGELVNGVISRASGYINWIHGYLTNIGLNAAQKIRSRLSNMTVQLGYKMSSFTDKKYITTMVEQFSPTSNSQSAIIPDENYTVHLNKSAPIRQAIYSAVIVEKTQNGYSVNGYNLKYPFFTVIPSEFNNNYYAVEELGVRAVIFRDSKDQKVNIPYGFEFRSVQQVADFLVSYQRHLKSQGFSFENYDSNLGHQRDWVLSIREFISWSLQGWKPGNILVLSPASTSLSIYGVNSTVDNITNVSGESQILGPNFNVIRSSEVLIIREPGVTSITTTTGQSIAYAELNLVQFEHVLVFDNQTVFNDIIYKPESGSRQNRIKIVGNKTANWTGELNPSGFIYSTGSIDEWEPEKDYKKADIVRYKNRNYSALYNLPGSFEFNYDNWSLLDSNFESELVPNLAHNAAKFENIYDIDYPYIDEVYNKFSGGLIGYRSRPYLENIGMDQAAQIKFYQGFIKEKGTKNSLTALYEGNFDNLTNEVSVFEEWGLRVGEYGSNKANRSIEIPLPESKFKANPVALKLLNAGDADLDKLVTIRPKDLVSRPENYSSPIFLNRDPGISLETDIKTAGYVKVDDVDRTLFDFVNFKAESDEILAELYSGYKLWVAKDFGENWQIFSIIESSVDVAKIEWNLDNKALITTTYDHGLKTGDVFAIRGFDDNFDGFYQALYVEQPNTIAIQVTEEQTALLLKTPLEAIGDLFVLQAVRYANLNARDLDVPKEFWKAGDRVWVDKNNDNKWAVYEFVRGELGNFVGPKSYMAFENGSITVRSNGLPYHSFGNSQITNTAVEQNYDRTWPLYAGSNVAASASSRQPAWPGVVGFAVNGVAIINANYGSLAPTGYLTVPGFSYNLGFAGLTGINKDSAGGITDQNNLYAYYGYTFTNSWNSGIGATNGSKGDPDVVFAAGYLEGIYRHLDGHSKIMGFALDGYPIYGPYGYSSVDGTNAVVKRMVSKYKLKDPSYRANTDACDLMLHPMGIFVEDYTFNDEADLDEFNGRYCVTPDYPDGTYAYFMTVNEDNSPAYPYAVGPSFYGPVSVEIANSVGIGAGRAPASYRTTPADSEPLSEYRQWTKFSHRVSTEAQPASLTESNYWRYDVENDIVECENPSDTYTGFISSEYFEQYEHDVTLYSTVGTSGSLAVVLAFAVDGLGREHTLSAVRGLGSVNQGKTWSVVYNYLRSDEWVIYDGSQSAPLPGNLPPNSESYNWQLFKAGTRINVIRDSDVFTVKCSQFNNIPLDDSTILTVNLATDSRLAVFKGPQRIGYAGQNQRLARFRNIRFVNIGLENTNWRLVKEQEPVVNIDSISNIYLVNRKTKTIVERLDFIDPVKGKILGSAAADIDFVSDSDPAKYNVGTRTDLSIDTEYHWGEKQVGMIWWDTDTVRFVDYEQDNNDYRLQNWARIFPGSSIDVYEWVASDVPPSQHVSAGLDGIPKFGDNSACVQLSYVDDLSLEVKSKFYYWVKDRTTVTKQSKTLSSYNIAYRISEPSLQSIPYAAILRNNAIALYNIGGYLSANDIAIHIEYKVKLNESITHSEYQLFPEGNDSAVMDPRIEDKIIDSLVGQDKDSNPVPDPALMADDRIGLSNKPRQTVILNRTKAIQDVLKYVNSILINHPVALKIIDRFNVYSDNFYAAEPEPVADRYDYVVDSFEQVNSVPEFSTGAFEIGKQYIITEAINFDFTTIGASSNNAGTVFTATGIGDPDFLGFALPRRIFVKDDINFNNRWSIYVKDIADGKNTLTAVQSFDTANTWYFTNWFESGYSVKTLPDYTVETFNDIYKIENLQVGKLIKVKNDGSANFNLFRYDGTDKYTVIGIQNGTIQIKNELWNKVGYDFYRYDEEPWDYSLFNELRYIIKGLKEDIFVDNLAIYYNRFLLNLVDFILAEQKYSDWIFKTSFVSIKHRINALKSSTSFIKNKQEYYEDYVNEIKPYRTKVREYNLEYFTGETAGMGVSDFDLPSYWDATQQAFRSPSGKLPGDNNLINTLPRYQDWKNNHKFEVESVVIGNPGYGHLTPPDISIISNDVTGMGANAVATINPVTGEVTQINVVNSGKDYTLTPTVAVSGSGTTSLSKYEEVSRSQTIASVRINNKKIRKLKTSIRFDRVNYSTNVVDWQPNVAYPTGTYLTYKGNAYITTANVSANNKFISSSFTPYNSADFDNANDRIWASYTPKVNMVPRVLSRLVSGLDNTQINSYDQVTVDTAVTGGGLSGQAIPAGQFQIGTRYIITTVGNTDFTLIGAFKNLEGVIFVATGPGSGTGSAAVAITGNTAFPVVSGLSPDTIVANGGTFISELFSHAPEELLPGRTYDSLTITLIDSTQGNNGVRLFVNMNNVRTASNASPDFTTTLAAPLNLTDTTITVVDGSKLDEPNPVNISPGILHINGERIEYYTKNNNILGQIRRGVGGTGILSVHPFGSSVYNMNRPSSGYTQLGNP